MSIEGMEWVRPVGIVLLASFVVLPILLVMLVVSLIKEIIEEKKDGKK